MSITSSSARRRAAGFTLIEIMITVVVTSIGFAAVFAMQLGSAEGNIAARDMGAAVNLGERFAETLRQEAFAWTEIAPPAPHLNQDRGVWHTFTPAPVDHNGRAHIDDDAAHGTPLLRQRFCVHYWIDSLTGTYDGVLDARVRVVWPRSSIDTTGLSDICSAAGARDFEPDVAAWFMATVPVALRRHPKGGV